MRIITWVWLTKKWVMQKVEDYTKILGKVGNAKESLSGIVELRTKLFIAELESKQPLDSLEKSLDNIEKKLLLQVDCEERIHKALGQWPRDEKRRNLARIEIQIAELGRDIVQSQRRFDSDMRDLEFQIALEEAEEQDWYAQQQAYEDSYNTQEASSDFDPRRVYYGNQFRDLRHNYSSNPDHRPVSGR